MFRLLIPLLASREVNIGLRVINSLPAYLLGPVQRQHSLAATLPVIVAEHQRLHLVPAYKLAPLHQLQNGRVPLPAGRPSPGA